MNDGKNKEEEVVVSEKEPITTKQLPTYFSYQFRLISVITIIAILCLVFVATAGVYLKNTSDKVVNYTENGKINYKVDLKDNSYYDNDEYGEENRIYIANLIDKINIDYSYDFNIDREITADFYYDLCAYLVIKDGTSDSIYLKKRYDIEINSSDSLTNMKSHNVAKTASIDYEYYNILASRFKADYGVDTESYLRVELNVKKSSSDVDIPENSMYVDIPLSERSVNITISPMGLNNYSQTVENSKINFNDRLCLVCLIVIGLLILYMVIYFSRLISKLFTKKSKYQKYINKLLREYDRLIVEVSSCSSFDGKNIMELADFKELLDVRDNFKVPIMYYELVKNHKSYFYIVHDNEVYLYIVKNVD